MENISAWLEYLQTSPGIWWFVVPVVIVLVLQLLPKTLAGGKIFDRSSLWITLSLVTAYSFFVFLLPYITTEVMDGWFLTTMLGLSAIYLRLKFPPIVPKENSKDEEIVEEK